ncbi:MAG TPA: ribonuclease H-like YkuK family protein [Patescibacteria group bacterium]|nr:ribonuclease H-like YkuK family protein [Patescibacteria group bacterium]
MAQPNGHFTSPTKGPLTPDEMIEEVSSFIDSEPQKFYRIVIGSDSQAKHLKGKGETDFVTALIVHREGSGARYFWKKEKATRIPQLHEKIFTETQLSLAAAQELVPLLRSKISPTKYDFEIHIDVGPLGPTRDMIKEVVGMVNGNGFKAKTKPESWGASSVADKHT